MKHSIDLKDLLYVALNDGAVYSALVPWVLDARPQALTLSAYVQQRQVLQQYQLQVACTRPHGMRQVVLLTVDQCYSHACSLSNDCCLNAASSQRPAGDGEHAGSASKLHAGQQQGAQRVSTEVSCCSLSQPAMRLSKLHGHMLAHGLVPNLAEQLHMLLLLLTSGPLPPNSSSRQGSSATPTSSSRQKSSSTASTGKAKQKASQQEHHQQQNSDSLATAAGASPAIKPEIEAVASPQQLLCCRACGARYAAKALECCSKLLCCLPRELLQRLAASAHAQHYRPGLAALMAKAAAAAAAGGNGVNSMGAGFGKSPAGGSSQPTGSLAHQQQQQQHKVQQPISLMAAGGGSRPSSAGGVAAGGSCWGATPASSRAQGGGARLSGLGAFTSGTPGTAGSAGRGSAGGAGSAGRAASAAVCNREKSRDQFFSILRRCSSRLEALRQQQAAGSNLEQQQQRAAAAAVFTTELSELVSDVGLAAKQLLLQLAPGNQVYLAELFTACVLQAASSGEPILEPQLALMAQREPSKFQKLQQRLADRAGGSGASSPVPVVLPASIATTATVAAAGLEGSAGRGAAAVTGVRGTSGRLHTPTMHSSVTHQQRQQSAQGDVLQMVPSSQRPSRVRPTPQSQGLAATGLLYKLPPGSGASSTGGGSSRAGLPTGHRHIKPTPSSANSTGGSFRLAAAAGLSTPLPFSASGAATAAAASPVGSPLPPLALHEPTAGGGGTAAWGAGVGAGVRSPPSSLASRMGQASSSTGKAGALQTPASAPAAAFGAGLLAASSAHNKGPASAPHKAPAAAVASAASEQPACNTQVVMQLLSELPAGQHVLMLVLHAADSSSFNRSLLTVMLSRAEALLSSCPASLAAAGGLGQQAASVVALASYCSYLSFVAGSADEAGARHSSSSTTTTQQQAAADSSSGQQRQLVLQQQPVIDVAALLARVTADSSSSSQGAEVDSSWCLALAVPFVCQFLRFAAFNPSAASSPSVMAAVQQLEALLRLPCMSASHAAFGSLPACLASCLQGCQLLHQMVHISCQQVAAAVPSSIAAVGDQQDVEGRGSKQQQPLQDGHAAAAAAEDASTERLCDVLGHGSVLVDDAYWAVCCPGLQQLTGLLADVDVATQNLLLQQQHQQRYNSQPAVRATADQTPDGTAAAGKLAAGSSGSSSHNKAGAVAASTTQDPAAMAAAPEAAASASSSPSGAGGSALRHTTPLLLAPRAPPVLDAPPACLAAALAEAADPIKQQLQQAFIGQYSTEDNPVKMRDVLALVNSILCANSLGLGLSQGVPAVLQQHLDAMQAEVARELAPGSGGQAGGGATLQLQGQGLARAVHTLCAKYSAPAIHAALESAMERTAEHASQAAAAACAALLPADVPPSAAAAAAALVASSCKASCAQRLLQEVPVLVQSTLADHADALVRLITRQWAVHNRMTTPTTASAATAASNIALGGGSSSPSNVKDADKLQPPSGSEQQCQPGPAVQAAVVQPVTGSTLTGQQSHSSSTAKSARRINPVLVAASSDTAVKAVATDSLHRNLPVACEAAGAPTPAPTPVAAAQVSAQDTADVRAASAGVVVQAEDPAAAVAPSLDNPAVTAEDLLRICKTSMQGTGCIVCRELAVGSMQVNVAAAVVERNIEQAVQCFLSTALQLQHQENEQQDVSQANPQSWSGVIAAAVCAADLLVAGAAAGCYPITQLEQQLVILLREQPQAWRDSNSETAAAQELMLQQRSVDQAQQMCQLLAGAVLRAFLGNSLQHAAVWGSFEVAGVAACNAAPNKQRYNLPHFVKLPALMMKVARADGPQWLLQQLRVWLQEATLGQERVTPDS